MEIRKVEAGQSESRFASDGVKRLRVATTCGSPLIFLISGRLPAQMAGKVVHVAGAFRHGVNVVGMINPHVFVVDVGAAHSVTNAIAVFVGDPANEDADSAPPLVTARDVGAGVQSGVTRSPSVTIRSICARHDPVDSTVARKRA